MPIVKRLKIQNIGLIESETIELNRPLLLFYGEIRQGKTTILNCVRWVCGGPFPSDIIRHGQKEGSIDLELDNGVISRSFYIAKDGKTTKARDVIFVKDNKPVASPVKAIQAMLNPFLLDQDYLRNMNELERKRYFAELFKVDTSEIDAELATSESAASALRSELKGFGEIDVTPVERVNVDALKLQLGQLRADNQAKIAILENQLAAADAAHQEALRSTDAAITKAVTHNARWDTTAAEVTKTDDQIEQLLAQIASLRASRDTLNRWCNDNPKQEVPGRPAAPDTSKIKQEILDLRDSNDMRVLTEKLNAAAAQNVRAEQYERNLERSRARAAKQTELDGREKRQRELRAAKLAKLSEVSQSTGIPELAFDANGEFTYQGTQAGMLSTSQIMELSSKLSALYPEGFGIELLDRGESLGKSIFEFVERAKAEDITILATIVGERPATTPPEVGVFVVEKGKIKS